MDIAKRKAPAIDKMQFAGTTHPVVCVDAGRVAEHVRTVLAGWPQVSTEPDAAPISVVGDQGYYSVTSPFLDEPLHGLSSVGAACGAIVDAAQSFLAAHPDHLCLHAMSFEIAGRLVIATGTARMGKSTLAARMAAEPVLVYADDMLPITAPDNFGLALGVPPRPRLPLPEGSGETLAGHVRDHAAADDGRYCYLDTSNIAPHGRTAPIGVVLLLDRRADGPAGFAPADRAEALRHLLLRNMVRTGPASALTGRLEGLLESVPCIRLFYSSLDDAAALLMDKFAAWPVDAAGLVEGQPEPGTPLEIAPRSGRARGRAIAPEATFMRAPGIVAKRVGDEVFLFDRDDTTVLNLNALAGAVWALLEEPISAREAGALLADAFADTPRIVVMTDAEALFADLERNGLIVSA
ncbi:PqqD family protein [Pelagibacterium luteolum]|nr:PqqD family protein [Pelagibacterium luteolum]